METEILATSFLKTKIASTDLLKPFIAENDKEPIWDGYINVYSKPVKSLENQTGRVPVQVKGKKVDSKVNYNEIKYSVTKNSLDNFFRDGGAVFFVVYINTKSEFKIYYRALLPVVIKNIRKKIGVKKSISIKFNPLPDNATELQELFINFLNERSKQAIILNTKHDQTFEELRKIYPNPEISFSYTTITNPLPVFPPTFLLDKNLYLYANFNGFEIPFEEVKLDKISKDVFENISIRGVTYFDKYVLVMSSNHSEMQFGNSVKICPNFKERTVNINFLVNGSLNEQIAILDFIVAFTAAKEFSIGQHTITFDKKSMKHLEEQVDIADKRQYLKYLRNTKLALELSGCKTDLKSFDESDTKNIDALISNFVEKNYLSFDDNFKFNPLIKISVGNIKLLLIAEIVGENLLSFKNYFTNYISVICSNDDRQTSFNTSQFVVMKGDDFFVDNIDFNLILNNIFEFEHAEGSYAQINELALRMLSSYDSSNNEYRNNLLSAAIELTEWLMKKHYNSNDAMWTLNYLQAIKRHRKLQVNETAQLYDILKKNDDNCETIFGVYVLLGESEMAKRSYEAMSEERQRIYQDYPIMNLLEYDLKR